ncbi:MAG: DinB family protein [Anaerolineae bacterium]|nr:DinB family protein [Anaerolineae bacterium]
MDAFTLQEQLDDVRVRLLESLATLPDEALLAENAVGAWSLADVLVHFVNWEAELVTALNKIDQGKTPGALLRAMADRDAYNAARYAEMKGRDLDRIFDDLQGVRGQLEEWLEEFSERGLEDPERYPALKGKPLWKLIAENSFEHEAAHLPAIEAFAEQWALDNPDMITPDEIEVRGNGAGD